jgi:hypothetical protein
MWETPAEATNRWLSMWYSPRHTIRKIVDGDPNRYVVLLSALAGIATILFLLSGDSSGERYGLPILFALAILGGAPLGVLVVNVGSHLLDHLSQGLGGQGTPGAVRAAYAWSCIPKVCGLPLWLLAALLFGHRLFTAARMTPDQGYLYYVASHVFFIIQIILEAWSLVLLVVALSETERFSPWRALAALFGWGLIMSLLELFILVLGQMMLGLVSVVLFGL